MFVLSYWFLQCSFNACKKHVAEFLKDSIGLPIGLPILSVGFNFHQLSIKRKESESAELRRQLKQARGSSQGSSRHEMPMQRMQLEV